MKGRHRKGSPRGVTALRLTLVVLLLAWITAGGAATAATGPSGSAVTATKTVSRTYLENGVTTTVDKRDITLSVSQTTDLKSLQQIKVSWSGAQPTAGITTDPNSDFAQNQEHSMALFECRGVDSASAPTSQRISPQTCWTQFADERFSYGYDQFPAWRADVYATPAERQAVADAPAGSNATVCTNTLRGTSNQRWVPFIGADSTVYGGGPFGCAGQAPEASPANLSSLALPSNETFGVTGTDGTGQANFDIFTGEDHASLGCSQTVACTLVAVPIEGISCDAAGTASRGAAVPPAAGLADAQANCETAGNFKPGQLLPSGGSSGAAAVNGSLWWSASNWRNRISVPLTFAPPDNACSLFSNLEPRDVYGSELMIQATTQWAPYFCLKQKSFNFQHIQSSEPQARNLLATGNIEAAFTSDPPTQAYTTPTVSAPVAVSGFGIAFSIDDVKKNVVTNLRLNARLLAKLMTESYPDQPFVRDPYPTAKSGRTLSANPLNISKDPEFQALNPGLPQVAADGAATLLSLNTDSDVMYALTSYINSDPIARLWLNGNPDPWGMTVNPNYKGISLPVNNWPVLDTFVPTAEYKPGLIDCLIGDNVPYLPLVAAPTAALFNIGLDMQFAISQSQTVCSIPSLTPGDLTGAKMVAQGRQTPGFRFMFGLVSAGDAERRGLNLASLQTQNASSIDVKFSDASGRSFAAPTQAGMKAAAAALTPDQKSGTWSLPYDKLRTDTANAAAYPGTMVVYAAIPTKGLPAADAKSYSQLLNYVAGPGQVQSPSQGDLPLGYLPMTTANGLGALANYTVRAAAAVAAQSGVVPALIPVKTPATSAAASPTATPSGTTIPNTSASPSAGNAGGGGGGSGNGTTGSGGTGGPAGGSPTGASSATGAAPKLSSTPSSVATKPLALRTPIYQAGVAGLALPAILVLMLAAGVLAGGLTLKRRILG